MSSGDGYAHKGDRPPWSWQGAVALVLAISIGGGWLFGIVLAALEAANVSRGLDDELAGLLNGIGQVLAGALGTYLGFAAGAGTRTRDTPQTTAVPEIAPGDR